MYARKPYKYPNHKWFNETILLEQIQEITDTPKKTLDKIALHVRSGYFIKALFDW